MYSYMRTTLILEDSVFRKAKKRALEAGTTLSDLTNTALRHFLAARSQAKETPFVMPVFRGAAGQCHQSPADLARLRDEGR